MDAVLQDLRHAARTLGRRPGLALVAVLTIGFGIGAATAIFSVADAVVLRPLPFVEPDRLVMLWQEDPPKGEPFIELGYPTFRDWRERSRVFEQLAGQLEVPFLGRLPVYQPIREGSDNGVPIIISEPGSSAGRAFMTVAERTAAQVSILAHRTAEANKGKIPLIPVR